MRNQKLNWILDVVILLGFLISFFLNLTGLAVHQWLGVAVFLGIMFHLVNHWDWVICVFSGFFGKTCSRTRIYALIDGLLLYGFVLIIETGLVISTWFNLNLTNYEVWLDIHIYSSIATLSLAVLKIGLHWRWIVKTAAKIFKPLPDQKLSPQVLTSSPQTSVVSRRDFLVTMGVVGLGSALAISNVLPSLKKVEAFSAAAQNADSISTTAAAQAQPKAAATQTQAATSASTEAPTAVQTATVQPTVIPTNTSAPVAQNSLACYATCPKRKHCSFPGDCGRYSDTDGNGLCDLGECS
ncbi:MAG: hypothetical protein CVU42_10985 [Chloroflexi bacterium HGW-Chloroflexi-4]|nr:MAG: hypothetical protein CVU42_10985 [Chloroflexi bacterium HGW-Chloroflexi-4]